jgi:hypothetical protein
MWGVETRAHLSTDAVGRLFDPRRGTEALRDSLSLSRGLRTFSRGSRGSTSSLKATRASSSSLVNPRGALPGDLDEIFHRLPEFPLRSFHHLRLPYFYQNFFPPSSHWQSLDIHPALLIAKTHSLPNFM